MINLKKFKFRWLTVDTPKQLMLICKKITNMYPQTLSKERMIAISATGAYLGAMVSKIKALVPNITTIKTKPINNSLLKILIHKSYT